MTARLRALDPMKGVEEMGQLALRNPHPGVLHGKLDVLCIACERDANAPCKGMLEGVGEQVEDDFLPHVSVDIDRLCERRPPDGECQAPFPHRPPENPPPFLGNPPPGLGFGTPPHPPPPHPLELPPPA